MILAVAFYVVWERKLIGWMHIRHGPMYVGWGVFQAFADVFKLLFKEVIQPSAAHKVLFVLAPLLALVPAFAAWAVVPFDAQVVLSNANAGLLYLLAMTSLGVYGIIIAGWASNSKYAFLGAMRASAQMISYEIAMGFSLVGVLIAAGSLNLSDIVMAQAGKGFLGWFFIPLAPLFVVYFVSGVAETNRAPFDVVEGESEIVAGHMIEYLRHQRRPALHHGALVDGRVRGDRRRLGVELEVRVPRRHALGRADRRVTALARDECG